MIRRLIKNRKGVSAAVSLLLAAALFAGCTDKNREPETSPQTEKEAGISAEAAVQSEKETGGSAETEKQPEMEAVLPDGVFKAEVSLSGGSGRAGVDSPCEVTVTDGQAEAEICWSSPHYDYMVVNGENYQPVNTEGNSRFRIPVILNEEMPVQADTTAMSKPHLIDYTLYFTIMDETISGEQGETEKSSSASEEEAGQDRETESSARRMAPEIPGLSYESEMEKQYAEDFSVFYYAGGYKVLEAASGRQYLLVPEGGLIPETLPADMTVLQAPLKNIYLAASSVMALFHALDVMDAIAFSGTEAEDWYIEDASEAMRAGRIAFAGKYSQPDYEGLLAGDCGLAVESTMILHTPEVQEKLEALGIPVLIDESSHESHPLGRTEWIRFYGALLDREEQADAFFSEQDRVMKEMEGEENTGKTVAYFYVNSAGNVVVRKTEDYIPGMIRLAGGVYIFPDLQNSNPESSSGSVTLSSEEFYAQARDCDYLIYNAAIEKPLNSTEELIGKNPVFALFKAVKEDRVYTTDKYMYQATDIMAELIRDIHKMLTGADDSDMLFLRHVGA